MIRLKTSNSGSPEPEVKSEVPAKKDLTYNQKYYEKRKLELSEKKKARYLNDAEYRKSISERAIARWFDKLKKNPVDRMKDLSDIPFEKRHMRIIYKGENKIRFYSAKALAKIIGVSTETLKNWHDDSILPMPAYVEGNFKRWYSEFYVENVRQVVLDRRCADLKVFKSLMTQKFEETPDIDFTGKSAVSDEERTKINEMFDGE